MKAKHRTAAQVAEDCLVYDKPVTLQHYADGVWRDAAHLHAAVNRAVGAEQPHFLFRVRYFALLDSVRRHPQTFRLLFFGDCCEIADYDDYNERHRVIKLTAKRMICGTLTLISQQETLDRLRQPVMTEQPRDVYCAEYEITQEDRAAAQQMMFSLSYRLRVFTADFCSETLSEYAGRRLRIFKATRAGDMTELYLGERIGAMT